MEEKKKSIKKRLLNNKKKVKGKALTAWIIVIIIISMIVTFGSGLIVGKLLYEDKKNITTKVIDNTVDEKLGLELAHIAEIDFDETASNFITPLLFNNGVINDLSADVKTAVVYAYALKSNLLVKVTGEEEPSCADGQGFCNAIKKSDFNEIIKKYGISEYVPSNAREYNDMYLFNYGGNVVEYNKATHSYSYSKIDNNIIIIDKIVFEENEKGNKTEYKEFTFKKNKESGNYYLYSVFTR